MTTNTIKILSINDPNVIDAVDDGYDIKHGHSRAGRRNIEAMLNTRDTSGMLVFRVAEMPTYEINAEDPFRKFFIHPDTGAFMPPGKEWRAEREKRCAEHTQRQVDARDAYADADARKILKGLKPLLGLNLPNVDDAVKA